MDFRDRIKELRRVDASELLPNERNWRLHSQSQQNALRGVLEEIGWAGALVARELPDGSLELIDGHLRAEVGQTVPVLVLDVNEAEADKLLVTLDPISAMAKADAVKLEALLQDINTGSEAVQEMLAKLATDAGIVPPDFAPADETTRLDQVSETICPNCGHSFKPCRSK